MLALIATCIGRYPRWLLAGWFLVAALSLPLAARVGEVLTSRPDSPPGSVAEEVRRLLEGRFADVGDTAIVMVAQPREGTVREPAFQEPYQEVLQRIRTLPQVTAVRDAADVDAFDLVPGDASYTAALVYLGADDDAGGRAAVTSIRALFAAEEDISFTLAGGPATVMEIEEVSARDAHRAELFGLPLSFVVLGIAFGALVASVLPLIVAATSIVVSLAALFLLGQVVEFAVFTQSVVTMLGLATGIDYALLMVNRFREELRNGETPRHAAERTTRTAGKAVAFSGLTVMIALSALLVPPLSYIRSIGVGTILVLFVSVSVSLTALPAVLALLGHRVNWLRLTRREPGLRSRGFWRERAHAIMRRPWFWTVTGCLVLVALSLPAFRMQVADPGPLGLSERTEARQTVTALEGLGLEGLLSPVDVLADFGPEGFFTPSNVRALSRLERAIADLDRVDITVSAMSAGSVPRLFLYQYYATPELARDSEVADLVARTISRDDRLALIQVVPTGNLSPSQSADLRSHIRELAAGLDLAVMIGGNAVWEAEWSQVLFSSLPLAVGIVYLVTLLVLGLAFRSLMIPVKSIVLNTLTVGAAYGVITALFQEGWLSQLVGLQGGLGFIDTTAPLFIFAMVFGLSMDYEVFLVARMYEAHERGLSDREAVATALSATGGVITSAAAVMIVVFSLFILSEVVLIKTLGVGMAVAVLLDATLVRLALVPAVMTLAGRWNWWLPGPLARLAERLDLRHD